VPEKTVRVTVTFLGLLRDQMGAPRLELDLPAPARLDDLVEALAPHVEGRLGEWAWDRGQRRFTSRVSLARGATWVDKQESLADGEEIIVFPPMAGG
jgi:molybdopterin converting factor small subunit